MVSGNLGVGWLSVVLALVMGVGCGQERPSEEQSLGRARGKLLLGNPKGALLELRNAMDVNPRNPETRMLLGQADMALFQGVQAEKEFRRAYDLGMRTSQVLIGLTESILSQRRYKDVLATLDDVGRVSASEDAKVHALRAEAYEGLGDLEQASKLYKEALSLSGASVPARLGLARLALKGGRTADARGLIDTALKVDDRSVIGWGLLGDLERLEKNLNAAEQAYTKAAELSPVPGVLQLKLAQVETELGDYAGARRNLEAARKVSPTHPMVAITEGLLEYRLGNLTKAQSALETGLSGDPDNKQAAYYLGVVHYARRNWTEAVKYLTRAGAENGQGFNLVLATAKLNAGDVAGAAALLDKALDVAAADPKALALMARVRFAQGDLEAGRKLADQATALDPEQADLYVDLGLKLLQQRKTGKAMVELEGILAQQPDSLRAQTALYAARVQAGDLAGALSLAKKMRDERPNDASPLVLMALLKVLEKDVSGAETLLRQALQLDPANVTAASNLAALAVQAGRFDEARDLYSRVLSADKDNVPIRLKSAVLELKAGKPDEFERQLSSLLADHPEQLSVRLLLARYYIRLGAPFQAVSLLKQLGDFGKDQRPDVLAVTAEAQMALGDTENAVRTAEAWVGHSPKDPYARFLLARGYAETRNRDGLDRELFAAIDLAPDSPMVDPLISRLIAMAPSLGEANRVMARLREAHPDLAYLAELDARRAIKEGDSDEAVKIYRRALHIHPDDRRWPIALYQLYLSQTRLSDARMVLDSWLERHPDDPIIRFYSGDLYLAQGADDQASGEFSAVLEKAPNNVAALNNLGWLLLEKAPRSALYHAQRAAELGGRSGEVLDTLGLALMANGKFDQAVEVLTEACSKMPESKEICIHLAQAWHRQGKSDKAKSELESILAGNDEFPEKAEALRLLRDIGQAAP